MKVLIAMDSFKGSFSSLEVANIVERGIKKEYLDAEITKIQVADGGEGTLEAIVDSLKGEYIHLTVKNPLNEDISAKYGMVGDMAIIEMAQASGLNLVPFEKRNPMLTSTFGTGQIIMDAVARGCKKMILGIGGSATNDGGCGMARAFGIKFLDSNGNEIADGGGELNKLYFIDITGLDDRLRNVEFEVACDVTNTLCGQNGASFIFAPQKGANRQIVEELDNNLNHLSVIVEKQLGIDAKRISGTGAAGGLAYGLLVFSNAKVHIKKGVEIVLGAVNFENYAKSVDIIITGEGRVDNQTIYGKVLMGVATIAKKHNKPVFAIAGYSAEGSDIVYEYGIDAVMSSVTYPTTIEDAIASSEKHIEQATQRLFRIIKKSKEI